MSISPKQALSFCLNIHPTLLEADVDVIPVIGVSTDPIVTVQMVAYQ